MSKTPYEIRLDLLKLAKDSLFEATHSRREALMTKFHASRETFVNESAPRDPLAFPELPDFPDTSAILAEAEKLKNFVDAS